MQCESFILPMLSEAPTLTIATRCALGSAFESRYHPTVITFPKTLVEFFADRAKSILETELDSPCVATIQAMVILSSHEVGNGKDARGWLYSGKSALKLHDLKLTCCLRIGIEAGIRSCFAP
jgi:hypothetical protein